MLFRVSSQKPRISGDLNIEIPSAVLVRQSHQERPLPSSVRIECVEGRTEQQLAIQLLQANRKLWKSS